MALKSHGPTRQGAITVKRQFRLLEHQFSPEKCQHITMSFGQRRVPNEIQLTTTAQRSPESQRPSLRAHLRSGPAVHGCCIQNTSGLEQGLQLLCAEKQRGESRLVSSRSIPTCEGGLCHADLHHATEGSPFQEIAPNIILWGMRAVSLWRHHPEISAEFTLHIYYFSQV